MIIRVIGDVHGYYSKYIKVVEDCEASIQLGDMGVGFPSTLDRDYDEINRELKGSHKFIHGNHDDPELCKTFEAYIPDGTYENGIFFFGGGLSIDKDWRIPGVSWWEGEELSYVELEHMIDRYDELKPSIMVTHECPTIAAKNIHSHHQYDSSRTALAMDRMFELHQPAMWIHAHHHVMTKQTIGKTLFVCLPELGYIDIEIGEE